LTGEQKKLARLEREVGQAGPEDLKVLKAQVDGLYSRAERVNAQLNMFDVERRQCRDSAARLRNDAEKLSQRERELRERLLSSIFPKLSDYGGFAIASIDAQRGCIVCGCVDHTHLEIAKKKLHEKLHCPLCDADPHLQEKNVVSSEVEYDKAELEDVASRTISLRNDAVKAEREEEAALRKYTAAQVEKYEIERDLRAASQKLAIAENAVGLVNNNGIKNTRDKLQLLQESVDEYKE
jgi:septal ring factor EnvC (AmiA/AmiB activator)